MCTAGIPTHDSTVSATLHEESHFSSPSHGVLKCFELDYSTPASYLWLSTLGGLSSSSSVENYLDGTMNLAWGFPVDCRPIRLRQLVTSLASRPETFLQYLLRGRDKLVGTCSHAVPYPTTCGEQASNKRCRYQQQHAIQTNTYVKTLLQREWWEGGQKSEPLRLYD
jgi:hypothetical protein